MEEIDERGKGDLRHISFNILLTSFLKICIINLVLQSTSINLLKYGGVAQLARAYGSYP
jgi:hypothetical protein